MRGKSGSDAAIPSTAAAPPLRTRSQVEVFRLAERGEDPRRSVSGGYGASATASAREAVDEV